MGPQQPETEIGNKKPFQSETNKFGEIKAYSWYNYSWLYYTLLVV